MEQEIIAALNERNGRTTFREIIGANASKSEVVSNFVALLELVHKKEIRCVQEGDEIHVYERLNAR